MPVYEVRFLIQAGNEQDARNAITVRLPWYTTEPFITQWGYRAQIDDKSAGIYARTLKNAPKDRKPRAPLSEERKAQLCANLAKARAARNGGKSL